MERIFVWLVGGRFRAPRQRGGGGVGSVLEVLGVEQHVLGELGVCLRWGYDAGLFLDGGWVWGWGEREESVELLLVQRRERGLRIGK